MPILDTPSHNSLSTELTKHYHRLIVWKLNWISLRGFLWILLYEYIFNVNSTCTLNISVNTTLFVHMQVLNNKLDRRGHDFFSKNLTGHENLSCRSYGLEKFENSSLLPFHILNVCSLSLEETKLSLKTVRVALLK